MWIYRQIHNRYISSIQHIMYIIKECIIYIHMRVRAERGYIVVWSLAYIITDSEHATMCHRQSGGLGSQAVFNSLWYQKFVQWILGGGVILWDGLECKGQGPGLQKKMGTPVWRWEWISPFSVYCSIPVVPNQKDQNHLGGGHILDILHIRYLCYKS